MAEIANPIYPFENHISVLDLFPKGRVGSGVLNRLLNGFLHFVPIAGVKTLDVDGKVVPDLHEHVPLVSVGHKRDGNPNTAETSSTTNTVQVGLVIGLLRARAGLVNFGNIL